MDEKKKKMEMEKERKFYRKIEELEREKRK
jgi:hypothetical protein